MIKSVIFPDRVFESKSKLFKALKENEDRIIQIKKAQIYEGREKNSTPFFNLNPSKLDAFKNDLGFEPKEDYIYPIISTTNFFDSHKDVHLNGSMTKTAKEQQGKVMYALDHELKYNSILAWEKDVNMFISEIPWGLVNKDYSGKTEALIFEISKDKIRNKQVLEDIENKVKAFQNSIRMVYYKITMGINSNEKDYIENKAYYDKVIGKIANKEEVEEDGYFFGVEELGIHKEGSLVVGGGSNSATSIYNIEPLKDTQKTEPSDDTQKGKVKIFVKF